MLIESVDVCTTETVVPELTTTYGMHWRQRRVIVRIAAASGEIGYGEASPLPRFTGETADTVETAISSVLGHVLIGMDPFDIDVVLARLDAALAGNTSAKAALDMALYDLMGHLVRQPVCKLLGGVHRSQVLLAEAIGLLDPHETVAEAERLVTAGVRTLKLKIGVDPDRDVVTARAVRRAVGDEVHIRLDANQGYSSQAALMVLRQLIDLNIEYVEQPVRASDLEGMVRIRQLLPVRLMADESLHSPRDALNLVQRNACDLFGIKLIKTGGLHRARQILTIGEQAGIDCVVISPWESEIGLSAGLHLAAAAARALPAQELTAVEDSAMHSRFSLKQNHGVLDLPTGPGLSIRGFGDDIFSAR